MQDEQLAARVAEYGWYHTIDLGDGVVTKGMFDHRPVLDRYRLPADLSGQICLDVATMDGFWAFEMERRGAQEVIALDIEDGEKADWPASLRPASPKTMGDQKGERFGLAAERLGSTVKRVIRSVYELDTDVGMFDFVFCGDLLVHLKDPITALERIRAVCRGSAVIVNPVREFRFARGRPMAQFDGIDEFEWWVTNLAALARMVRAAGFSRVETGQPFDLPATSGGSWKGQRGVVRGWV
jgi:tRNA (mo5U34)-methyltransferase